MGQFSSCTKIKTISKPTYIQLQSNFNPMDTCGCNVDNIEAIIMSKALIKCNYQWTQKFNRNLCDHRYVKHPADLANILKKQFGKPDFIWENVTNKPSDIQGKQGIIYLESITDTKFNTINSIRIYPNNVKYWQCKKILLWTLD